MEILRLVADFLKNYGKNFNLPPFLTAIADLFSDIDINKNPPFNGGFYGNGGNGGNGCNGGNGGFGDFGGLKDNGSNGAAFSVSSLIPYIAPIIEAVFKTSREDNMPPDCGLSPISDIADKDVVFSLNRYFSEAN